MCHKAHISVRALNAGMCHKAHISVHALNAEDDLGQQQCADLENSSMQHFLFLA